ncbi:MULTISPECIES: hypothetical protein [Nocardia]|uniref:hypothetical protein n=1 Tax=Nocardia TaxID=1817 RepID=UPI0013003161|nr:MULTISPECIES: hypothetical protein [Nocardia]
MSDPSSPSRVVLYSYAKDLRPHRVAEFTCTDDGGVTLTVVDDEWGGLAREYYRDGVLSRHDRRVVLPAEGAPFMRALLQPSRSTYYRFADESAK